MCTSVSRVLVQSSKYEEVKNKLSFAFINVQIGNPHSSKTDLGPLIDRESQSRILSIIDRACKEVDIILCGKESEGRLAAGCFVTPTLFQIDDPESWLVQEEHFGPIVSLEKFETEDDAVVLANSTNYGLASSVYTQDHKRAMRIGRKLKFGTIWVNCHNRLIAEAETGGYKYSGLGRLHGFA